MTDLRLPFDEVECPCLTCGRMVLKPRKPVGRHSRYCSTECKRVARNKLQRALRAENPERVAAYQAKYRPPTGRPRGRPRGAVKSPEG